MPIPLEDALNFHFSRRSGFILISGPDTREPGIKHIFWPHGYRCKAPHPDAPVVKARYERKAVRKQESQRASEIEEKITFYLRQRIADDQVSKKEAMRAQASSALGIKFSVRAFNNAYAAVFARSRGRPALIK